MVLKETKLRMLKLRVGHFNDLTKNMCLGLEHEFRHRFRRVKAANT